MKIYVIIEQAEDNEAYITHIKARNGEHALDEYHSVGLGSCVVLSEKAYNKLCKKKRN